MMQFSNSIKEQDGMRWERSADERAETVQGSTPRDIINIFI